MPWDNGIMSANPHAINGPYWPHRHPETDADKIFRSAILDGRYDDAREALILGADPNRPIFAHLSQTPQAPYSLLAVGASHLLHQTPPRPAALAFEELLLEMERKGADFSAPSFPGSTHTTPDEASSVFECSAKAAATYIRCKATPAILYNEHAFCGLLNRFRIGEPAPSELDELWEHGGFREYIQSLPDRRTTILTRLIGSGRIQSARWLASKGALPAPLIQTVTPTAEREGFGPLHMLACEMANWGRLDDNSTPTHKSNDSRKHLTVQTAFECAQLAIELGALPNAPCSKGLSPMQLALEAIKGSPEPLMAWLRACRPLGFAATANPNGKSLVDSAMADTRNAARLLALCEEFGSNLSAASPEKALACLSRPKLPESFDPAILALCQTLKHRGVDFSKACQGPFHEAHPAHAARHCLHGTLQFLLTQGLSPSWTHQGLSLLGLTLGASGSHEHNKRRLRCAKLLLAAGHPLDPARTASSPLALCARHLLRKEFKLLLDSGADPRLTGTDAQTAAHALFISTHKNSAPVQEILVSAMLADPRTPWGAVDSANRLPLEAACHSQISDKSLASILSATPQALLDESTPSGSRAWKAIRRRGGPFLALAESKTIEAISSMPSPRKARPGL